MAYEGSTGSNIEISTAFIESLQSDFKILSGESKKKYPQVKEVSDVFSVLELYIMCLFTF